MRKLGIAAVLAAGAVFVAAPAAQAGPPEVNPCDSIADTFATANIQMEPLPEPLNSTAGAAYATTCAVTG